MGHYSNHHRHAAKRSSHHGRRISYLWSLVFVVLLIGAGFYVYKYRSSLPVTGISGYVEKISTWVKDYRGQLKQKIDKAKSLVKDAEAPPPEMHFEFYSALPNMQMNATDAVSQKNQIQEKPANKKIISSANPFAVSAEELEKDFSTRMRSSEDKPRKNNSERDE